MCARIGWFCVAVLVGTALVSVGGPASAGEKIIIKYADQVAEEHPAVQAARFFGKRMAELTNNRVEVQVYHSSQLGNLREYMEGIQIGSIQMGMTTTPNMEVYSKKYMLASLPYVFKDENHAKRLLEGRVGEIFKQEAEKVGFKVVAFYFEGERNFFTTKKPIKTPDDLKGMKIRVMETPLMAASMDAFGATGVPMAFGELYLGLKTGIVDGAENTPLNYLQMKFYEVSKYYALTGHFNNPNLIVIGKKFFEGLPRDVQEAVLKTSHEAWEEYAMKLRNDILSDALNQLKAHGVTINSVDRAPFIQKARVVQDKFEKEIGRDLLEEVRKTQ